MKIKSFISLVGLIALTGLFSPTDSMAQKQFTLEDLNFGGTNYYKMRPEARYLTWWGDRLVRQDMSSCSQIDPASGKETTLFTLSDINRWAGLMASADQIRHLYEASFPYADRPVVLLQNGREDILVDFKAHKLLRRQERRQDTQARQWNSLSGATAYVLDNQLYVTNAKGESRQLTTDGSADIVYGQSVHRDEFGIEGGLYWSPKGNRLAFYRMDQGMVSDYPLVDIPELDWQPAAGESRTAKAAPIKYPMAGETSHKVTVGIYDLATGKTVYLQAGDPTDRYFTNIAWSPDETTVYLFELNRDQNDCRLVSYNALTGQRLREIYRETDERYTEPLHPIQFLPWDSDKFILQSQKDGYNHLYLFNKDGRQISQLTSGRWVVMEVLGFDRKLKSIVYASNECNPIQRNTWMVSVPTGRRTLLDNGRGYHRAQLSQHGNALLDSYSEPALPRAYDIITLAAKPQRHNYFTAPDPWKGYEVPQYTCGTLKAADGVTDLYWRMVKPVGFDPTKKYPTVVYVYGGPHAHNVEASWNWGSRGWETYMAQKGYLLFILDNRGSENRGKDFEQATFRHLGQVEMKDQMEGVRYLKSLPYVDQDRIGVHGWSFGGFMTISLITNYPDIFKVAVAGGPVIDWKWYEVMYGERYMDTPQSNPDGYAQTSLLNKAKDLKGKLQIIIGLNDPVVVPQHAFSFLKACIAAGTQPDFYVYPGEPHNMRGHQSVHLHERITQYFDDYLAAPKKSGE
ncbi:MAG: S9 family peptidase [Prevotella sp.]|nr:S9 family peptidase [Prevotella sp.]